MGARGICPCPPSQVRSAGVGEVDAVGRELPCWLAARTLFWHWRRRRPERGAGKVVDYLPGSALLEAAWLERVWVQLCLAASAHSLTPARPILAVLHWLLFFCTPAPLFSLEVSVCPQP